MSEVVSPLHEQLCRYTAEQRRFLQACSGREVEPVIPFSGPASTVRAAPDGTTAAPREAVRLSYATADGSEHLETVLGRADLLALGIGPWLYRFASEALLTDLLAEMLAASLQRASRLLGGPVSLRVRRLGADEELADLAWPAFIAESVPLLGRLRWRLSPALIEACTAHPMPRRNADSMRHVPLTWDVRMACIGLRRKDCEGLARGDVVRVLLSPVREAEMMGALVPHCAGAVAQPGGLPKARRWVKVLVDAGGWLNLKFEVADQQVEYAMEDESTLGGTVVPVNLTLPVAAMSLHEIDSVKPGTLVDTGVRLQDVEVALWSAGCRFATGRLVMIGEHLGVEIMRTERDLP